jgi:HK97 family phage major capsid protein
VRHIATTGSAAVVAEGAVKPELVYTIENVDATARKVAAHTAVSWEIMNDWDTFRSYVVNELTRQVITEENSLLLNDATSGGQGFLQTPGILTRSASGDAQPIDSLEIAIAEMRIASSLAEPSLAVFNPSTWSAIRRTKDSYGR